MEIDTLLGKRFDLHLGDARGQVLDVRVSAIDPERDQVTLHLLRCGEPRTRERATLSDVLGWIEDGTLTESSRP